MDNFCFDRMTFYKKKVQTSIIKQSVLLNEQSHIYLCADDNGTELGSPTVGQLEGELIRKMIKMGHNAKCDNSEGQEA